MNATLFSLLHCQPNTIRPPAAPNSQPRPLHTRKPRRPAATATPSPSPAPRAKGGRRRAATAEETGAGAGGSGSGSPVDEGASWRADYGRTDVRHGAFTADEKAVLTKAVADYAAAHGHSTDDYDWLLNRSEGKGGRLPGGEVGPVSAVAAALPDRTRKAVFGALQRMFSGGNKKVRGAVGGGGGGVALRLDSSTAV